MPALSRDRNRVMLSCLRCHNRRVKCDRKVPCSACVVYGTAASCESSSKDVAGARAAANLRKTGQTTTAKAMTTSSHRSESKEEQHQPPSTASSSASLLPVTLHHSPCEPHQSLSYGYTAPAFVSHTTSPLANNSPPFPPTSSVSIHHHEVGLSTPTSRSPSAHQLQQHQSFANFLESARKQDAGSSSMNQLYSKRVYATCKVACDLLPGPPTAELLISFYLAEIDWMYEVIDADLLDEWLEASLQRILGEKRRDTTLEHRLVQGDVTRLTLIFSIVLAGIQATRDPMVCTLYLPTIPCRPPSKSAYMIQCLPMLRALIQLAGRHDGPSHDLVRAHLMLLNILKNEGRLSEQNSLTSVTSCATLVAQCYMHAIPPRKADESPHLESARRLFYNWFTFDRFTAVHFGCNLGIDAPISTEIPLQQTKTKNGSPRNHTSLLSKFLLAVTAGKVAKANQSTASNITSDTFISSMEEELQHHLKNTFSPSCIEAIMDSTMRRTLDRQRHIYLICFYSLRGALHRRRFFDSDEQQTRPSLTPLSRDLCIESALELVKTQESLRLRSMSDHYVRCFYVPYFTLEPALTLVIAALMRVRERDYEQSHQPSQVDVLMTSANRAYQLLSIMPNDVSVAVRGQAVLARILSKASIIINESDARLYHPSITSPSHSVSSPSSWTLRGVLSDDNDQPLAIPYLEPADENNSMVDSFTSTSVPTIDGAPEMTMLLPHDASKGHQRAPQPPPPPPPLPSLPPPPPTQYPTLHIPLEISSDLQSSYYTVLSDALAMPPLHALLESGPMTAMTPSAGFDDKMNEWLQSLDTVSP